MSIEEEWNEEVDIRAYYGEAPPAQVVFDDDCSNHVASDSDDEDGGLNDVRMPHPSILNKTRRLKSLRRLASGSSEESHITESGNNTGINNSPTSTTSGQGSRGEGHDQRHEEGEKIQPSPV